MKEVYTGKKLVSQEDAWVHVSQCTAVATQNGLGACAHPSYNQEPTRLLDEMFEELFKKGGSVNELYVAGGANSFVPGLGMIFGERNVERILTYLAKHFPHNPVHPFVIGDKDIDSLDLLVSPSRGIEVRGWE